MVRCLGHSSRHLRRPLSRTLSPSPLFLYLTSNHPHIPVVRNLQLPLRKPPTRPHPPAKTRPSSLHRLRSLRHLRYRLQLPPRRQDVQTGERDEDRVFRCGEGGGGDGWVEGVVWERVEDEDYREWVSGADVFHFVEVVYGSVS